MPQHVRFTVPQQSEDSRVLRFLEQDARNREIRRRVDEQYTALHEQLAGLPEYERLKAAAEREERRTPILWLDRNRLALYVETRMPALDRALQQQALTQWEPHTVPEAHPTTRESNPLALVLALTGIAAAVLAATALWG